jgi:hypothetical protein
VCNHPPGIGKTEGLEMGCGTSSPTLVANSTSATHVETSASSFALVPSDSHVFGSLSLKQKRRESFSLRQMLIMDGQFEEKQDSGGPPSELLDLSSARSPTQTDGGWLSLKDLANRGSMLGSPTSAR